MAEDLTGKPSPSADRTAARPILMDGDALAARRAPALAERAAAVTRTRGHPPRVLLVAFADAAGRAAYSARKVRAGARVGVEAVPLVIPFGCDTAAAFGAMREAVRDDTLDAVFLEFPFPEGIDGEVLTEAIPPELDVDVMTAVRVDEYLARPDDPPPLTVAAALALLDGYGVTIAGRSCVVVADDSPFARMFVAAFARRGASPATLVAPDSADLASQAGAAGLTIVAAGRPGLIPSSLLAPGSAAIDAGYFNPGGRGDIDTGPGIGHLEAYSPVPGGIGPMTVSALIERVIAFAERRARVK